MMKRIRCGRPAAALMVVTLFVGCSGSKSGTAGGSSGGASGGSSAPAQVVKIDGSSTVYMLTKAVVEEFGDATGNDKVTVGVSGTGGGFKKFCAGEIDICDASRPITADEMQQCATAGIKFIELPICFDALTIAVHPQATWVDAMKTSELKKLWEPEAKDKIMKWSDLRPEWPAEPFALYGAGDDSGTFEYFTEAIVEKKKLSRSDYNKSENDNSLVVGIAGNKYALGYIPYSYFVESKDKLKALKIEWDKPGQTAGSVEPTVENVVGAKYNPLSRPLFVYVNAKSAERPEVKSLVEFYLANAKKLSEQVHFIPLPDKAYEMASARFKSMQTGTGFGGVAAIGLPLEDILKKEPVH